VRVKLTQKPPETAYRTKQTSFAHESFIIRPLRIPSSCFRPNPSRSRDSPDSYHSYRTVTSAV
jgi:hypothetical protein